MITKLPEGKMTEARFWELVEMANWKSDKDYHKTKMIYLKTLTKEECKSFREMIGRAYGVLDNVATEDITDVGDDGYSDLLHHIIGLGKEEFYKHANRFSLIQKRASNSDYKESFAYCIPYDDDYDASKTQYSIKHVLKMAKESQKEIECFRKIDNSENLDKPPHLHSISQELADIDMLMENFLDNPTTEGLEELASAKSWIKNATNKIDKFFEKNRMELPRKFTENGHNGICTPLFSNTVHDAERVLEFLK